MRASVSRCGQITIASHPETSSTSWAFSCPGVCHYLCSSVEELSLSVRRSLTDTLLHDQPERVSSVCLPVCFQASAQGQETSHFPDCSWPHIGLSRPHPAGLLQPVARGGHKESFTLFSGCLCHPPKAEGQILAGNMMPHECGKHQALLCLETKDLSWLAPAGPDTVSHLCRGSRSRWKQGH